MLKIIISYGVIKVKFIRLVHTKKKARKQKTRAYYNSAV